MDFTNVTLEAEANRFIDEFQEITEPRSDANSILMELKHENEETAKKVAKCLK